MERKLRALIINSCKKEKCKYLLLKGKVYSFCDCDSNNRPPHFHSSECKNYLVFKVNISEHSHIIIMDKCILNNTDFPDDKKVDFLFVNLKKKVLCIIEMKSTKTKKRKERKREAYEQLEEVLAILRKSFSLKDFSIYAIACVGNKKTIPATLASETNRRVRFKELGAELCNGCEIEEFPNTPCRRNR